MRSDMQGSSRYDSSSRSSSVSDTTATTPHTRPASAPPQSPQEPLSALPPPASQLRSHAHAILSIQEVARLFKYPPDNAASVGSKHTKRLRRVETELVEANNGMKRDIWCLTQRGAVLSRKMNAYRSLRGAPRQLAKAKRAMREEAGLSSISPHETHRRAVSAKLRTLTNTHPIKHTTPSSFAPYYDHKEPPGVQAVKNSLQEKAAQSLLSGEQVEKLVRRLTEEDKERKELRQKQLHESVFGVAVGMVLGAEGEGELVERLADPKPEYIPIHAVEGTWLRMPEDEVSDMTHRLAIPYSRDVAASLLADSLTATRTAKGYLRPRHRTLSPENYKIHMERMMTPCGK